jgi:hypothetical protein
MWMTNTEFELGIALAVVALYLLTYDRVLNKYERDGGFRLGRVRPKHRGPGFILVFDPVDRIMRVELRTTTKVIEPEDVVTRDSFKKPTAPLAGA